MSNTENSSQKYTGAYMPKYEVMLNLPFIYYIEADSPEEAKEIAEQNIVNEIEENILDSANLTYHHESVTQLSDDFEL